MDCVLPRVALVVLLCVVSGADAGCRKKTATGGKSVEQWLALAKDPSADTRAAAAEALGQFPAEPGVRAALHGALRDASPAVRASAAAALWPGEEEPTTTVLPDVLTWLRAADPAERTAAARALARIGPPAVSALPQLQNAFTAEEDEAVQKEFAAAITSLERAPVLNPPEPAP